MIHMHLQWRRKRNGSLIFDNRHQYRRVLGKKLRTKMEWMVLKLKVRKRQRMPILNLICDKTLIVSLLLFTTNLLPWYSTRDISVFLLTAKCPIVANTTVPTNITVAALIKQMMNASLEKKKLSERIKERNKIQQWTTWWLFKRIS